MNFLADPKKAMWVCRVAPAVTWALWLIALLSDSHSRNSFTVTDILLLASLVVYIPMIYNVLPVYLFGGRPLGFPKRIAYFVFAGLTAGIGPIVWYFVSVDGVLRQMAKTRK